METNQAEENLKVIRTIMERAALYRRRLGPIMLVPGVVGTALGLGGYFAGMENPFTFAWSWLGAAFFTLVICLLVSRAQATGSGEPPFSPSARRVLMAMLTPMATGMILTVPYLVGMEFPETDESFSTQSVYIGIILMVPIWLGLYGAALIAAGQFSSRGVKILGSGFILGALVMVTHLAYSWDFWAYTLGQAKTWWGEKSYVDLNLLMAMTFGGFHLIAAAYLFITEKRGSST